MSDDHSNLGYGDSYFGAGIEAFLRKLAKRLGQSRCDDADKARVVEAIERELSTPIEEAKRHERRD